MSTTKNLRKHLWQIAPVLCLVFVLHGQCFAAISYVTSQRVAAAGVGSQVTAGLSTTTTDLIVAWVYWEDTAKTMTVTDSGSHSWTSKTQVTNSTNNRAQLWYAYGSGITSGAPTVTATLSSGTTLISLEVLQIAGTSTSSDPYDTEANGTGTDAGVQGMTSGAFTTGTADEVVIAGGYPISSGSCDTAAAIAGTTATLASCTAEYRIVSTTLSSVTGRINNTQGQPWVMSLATFKVAASGGGGCIPSLALMGVGKC